MYKCYVYLFILRVRVSIQCDNTWILLQFFFLSFCLFLPAVYTHGIKKKSVWTQKNSKEKYVLCGQQKKKSYTQYGVWCAKANAIKCKQKMFGPNLCHFAKRCIGLTRDFGRGIEHTNSLLNEIHMKYVMPTFEDIGAREFHVCRYCGIKRMSN